MELYRSYSVYKIAIYFQGCTAGNTLNLVGTAHPYKFK